MSECVGCRCVLVLVLVPARGCPEKTRTPLWMWGKTPPDDDDGGGDGGDGGGDGDNKPAESTFRPRKMAAADGDTGGDGDNRPAEPALRPSSLKEN